MASKVFNDFSNLYSEVIDGTITYEEFLDFTDPKNPNSIYKDTIKKIENAIGSKEFANIDSKTKARVLNYYKEVRTTGDADFLGIKENFGIDPATLVNHRLLLKSGLKPVLDLTDKSDPGDISGLPFSFVSDSQINNNKDAYFRFRSYNEAGIPSEFVARGVKVDTGDSRDNIYSYPFFNYGDVRINKNDDEPAVEGFFENGDQRDLNKGILNLYYKDLSPAIQNTAKTIGTLRDEYGKSIITSGRGWEKEDEKQFDQWAYENLRSGKTMKDLEDMTFDSPELKLNRERIKRTFQAPGLDGTPRPAFEGPVPSSPMQSFPQSIPQQGGLQTMNPNATGSINSLPNAALQSGNPVIPSLGPTLNTAVQEAQKATNFQNPMAGAYLFQKNLRGALGR